jgi:outer membrane protein assembly factor BamB
MKFLITMLFSISAFAQTQLINLTKPGAISSFAKPSINALTLKDSFIYASTNQSTVVSDGVITNNGGLYKINSETGKIAWHFYLDNFETIKGRVQFFKNLVIVMASKESVYLINDETGKLVNQFNIQTRSNAARFGGPIGHYSTVTIDNGMLYVLGEDLVKYDLTSQKKVWTVSTNTVATGPSHSIVKPLIYKNKVWYPCGDHLCANDIETGKKLFELDRVPGINFITLWGNPKVDIDGDIVFLSSSPIGIVKLNPDTFEITGNHIFDLENMYMRGAGFNNLIIENDFYLFKTRAGEIAKVDRNSMEPFFLKYSNVFYASLVKDQQNVYASTQGGMVYQIDKTTIGARKMWRIPLAPGKSITGNIVQDKETVYIATNAGTIFKLAK